MASRKLKTFEEKINAFLKGLESGLSNRTSKSYFLEKYSYLNAEEVEMLFNLGQEIRATAVQLAGQIMQGNSTTFEESIKPENNATFETIKTTMRTAIETKYPYIESERVSRLISHGISWYR